MALVQNEQERRAQAARDLADKIKLEAAFSRDMRGFFRMLRSDLNANRVGGLRMIRVEDYRTDLVAILRKHYRKISNRFGRQVRNQIDKMYGRYEIKQDEDEQANLALLALAAERAEAQSNIIINTTQREFDESLATVVARMVIDGEDLDDIEITRRINSNLRPRQEARADTIAVTETNAMAEGSKRIEVESLATAGATIDGEPIQNNIVKRWDAVLDERTRPSHVEADGQIVDKDEAFQVGGSRLMYPSDTSLGAPAEEIINCRCSAQYIVR